jgi:hypothetical protein
MPETTLESFQAEAFEKAQALYAVTALAGGLNSLPADADAKVGNTRQEIEGAKNSATSLLQRKDVLEKICPSLLAVSEDLREVTAVIAGGLFPSMIVPGGHLLITPLIVATMAVMLMRAGVHTICAQRADLK